MYIVALLVHASVRVVRAVPLGKYVYQVCTYVELIFSFQLAPNVELYAAVECRLLSFVVKCAAERGAAATLQASYRIQPLPLVSAPSCALPCALGLWGVAAIDQCWQYCLLYRKRTGRCIQFTYQNGHKYNDRLDFTSESKWLLYYRPKCYNFTKYHCFASYVLCSLAPAESIIPPAVLHSRHSVYLA